MVAGTLAAGVYRITFDTSVYFARTNTKTFFPSVPIVFEITDPTQHYHVPLLLSPFGFSTYRGS
jgi:5-hydroxyisourate hydrolase